MICFLKTEDSFGWLELNCQVQSLRVALGELNEEGSQYATDACLRRYLRARNWNVKRTEKMMRESLEWRASYKPHNIRWVSTFITVAIAITLISPASPHTLET